MNYDNPYANSNSGTFAADMAAADERASFITKTYLHLAGAIGALVGLEAILLQSSLGEQLTLAIFQAGNLGWLVVLGLFMVVSMVANNWARSSTSVPMQYAGLGLYVVAEAIILLPMLTVAKSFDPGIIQTALVTTFALVGVMTVVVFITRQDFSFMRSALMFGGFAAMGLIVCAMIFGFQLGIIFTYAMIAFACGHILYDTSNVLHHYRIGQHVAAALSLFASVALLFWYVLQLVMASRD